MDFVIAVDGPAASGKGTVASRLAADFALPYLDTGILYRAVGVGVADPGDPAEAEAYARALRLEAVDEALVRTAAAGEAASRVAAHRGVRGALIALQRDFAAQPGGAVLDGRDIGTVICPEAEVKLYVTASPEIRARRRWAELGAEADYDRVLAQVRERDARDTGRADAPLRPAEDAVILDTSDLPAEAAVARAMALVQAAVERARGA